MIILHITQNSTTPMQHSRPNTLIYEQQEASIRPVPANSLPGTNHNEFPTQTYNRPACRVEKRF